VLGAPGSEELVVRGEDDGLEAASGPELALDVRVVVSGGERADRQPLGDLAGPETGGEEPEDLELAARQRLRHRRDAGRRDCPPEPPPGLFRERSGRPRTADRAVEVDEDR
jgi:hypothetical protein